ncbi:MAG: glycosyltransferase family 39 protein [Planctomycetes bacterium]|nr:glycosyltransferase family 39 protein [Planctomycetota bacterium]MCB9892634.1 glycosyltransferase family 39 protein [Planctomycetota bacterium]MCB9919351.1 glycosyltransferase family 39 protein [Planctomycetota bacterium]
MALLLLGGVLTLWLSIAMPVFSQEAYYWNYAQHPALSYFDHPPMVAWLIWIGTSVFGDGALGLRVGTWASGVFVAFVGLQLLRRFGVGSIGRTAWLLFGMSVPALLMGRFLANPDAPLICFWVATVYALYRARAGALRWWVVAGACAGAALLSKYTAAFLAIGGAMVLVTDPMMRKQLLRPGPCLGVIVAAIVFLPVVLWNVQNDFESFRFQTDGRFSKAHFGLKWFQQLVIGQVLMIHPAVAIASIVAVPWFLRSWILKSRPARSEVRDHRLSWIAAFGLPLPAYFGVMSFWIQVKMNWLAPAIAILVLGLSIWVDRRASVTAPDRWFARGRIALVSTALLLLLGPVLWFVPSSKGTSWAGWDEIAQRAEEWEEIVDQRDGIEGNVFFFGPDYRDAAQLSRSLSMLWSSSGHHREASARDRGEPVLAQNVLGIQALQFDHWTNPASRIGQDAIFVVPRPNHRSGMVERASECFDEVRRVDHVEVRRLGISLFDAEIYECRGYRGPRS